MAYIQPVALRHYLNLMCNNCMLVLLLAWM